MTTAALARFSSTLTLAQRRALEVVKNHPHAAESNATNADKATIYWQTRAFLEKAGLIARDPGLDEHHRPTFMVTTAGKKALAPRLPKTERTVANKAAAHQAPAVAVKATPAKGTKAPKPVMSYYHDGKPVAQSWAKLCNLAYFFTAGIEGDAPRIPTKRLKEILAEAGIAEPERSTWEYTLPNGITLKAVAA